MPRAKARCSSCYLECREDCACDAIAFVLDPVFEEGLLDGFVLRWRYIEQVNQIGRVPIPVLLANGNGSLRFEVREIQSEEPHCNTNISPLAVFTGAIVNQARSGIILTPDWNVIPLAGVEYVYCVTVWSDDNYLYTCFVCYNDGITTPYTPDTPTTPETPDTPTTPETPDTPITPDVPNCNCSILSSATASECVDGKVTIEVSSSVTITGDDCLCKDTDTCTGQLFVSVNGTPRAVGAANETTGAWTFELPCNDENDVFTIMTTFVGFSETGKEITCQGSVDVSPTPPVDPPTPPTPTTPTTPDTPTTPTCTCKVLLSVIVTRDENVSPTVCTVYWMASVSLEGCDCSDTPCVGFWHVVVGGVVQPPQTGGPSALSPATGSVSVPCLFDGTITVSARWTATTGGPVRPESACSVTMVEYSQLMDFEGFPPPPPAGDPGEFQFNQAGNAMNIPLL